MVAFTTVLALAIALRVGLIIYGNYQDVYSVLKYTDVDYRVFSDAARYILHGSENQTAQGWLVKRLKWSAVGDPYSRETYRYTPLLAVILLPNELFHPAFGKFLFAGCDILIGYLLHSLGGLPANQGTSYHVWVTFIWLLNPMPANISTRGSAESVLGLIVIATLALVLKKRYDAAAMMLGLAVHFKIYPFIYGFSILASMEGGRNGGSTWGPTNLFTRARLRFTFISALAFFTLNVTMYSIWGLPFIEHTYLYHVTRKDHRHNFSPYFYGTYLAYSNIPSGLLGYALRSPLISFLPQMLLSVGTGIVFARRHTEDLPFAWFVQTVTFVTFNKVCTSQYFMWYLWLLPLVLPRLYLSIQKSITLLSIWVAAQAIWLAVAYQLEFLGRDVFLQLWAASIGFLIANSYVLVEIVWAYR